MKKKWVYGLLFAATLHLSGCSSLPKKFIRQKPKPAHTPAVVYIEQGPTQKKFSNEYYYKMHYSLWNIWQSEVLDNLGGNNKKLQRSSEEAYSHLDQMAKYLKPEKREHLQGLTADYKVFVDAFEKGSYPRSEVAGMKSDLERIKRQVGRDFYYEKAKEEILPDDVDLGAGSQTA